MPQALERRPAAPQQEFWPAGPPCDEFSLLSASKDPAPEDFDQHLAEPEEM